MTRATSPMNRLGIALLLISLFSPLVPPSTLAQEDDPAPTTGTLQIWVSGSDGASLSGATFSVSDASGANQGATSSGGLATVSNLAAGQATVTQTSAPGAYGMTTATQYVTIVGDGTVDVWFTNTAPPPPLDSDGDGIPDDQPDPLW